MTRRVLMLAVTLTLGFAGCGTAGHHTVRAAYVGPGHGLIRLPPTVPGSARPRRPALRRVAYDRPTAAMTDMTAAPTMDSPGWALLARGSIKPAVDAFANEAIWHPDSGLPRVGHALATASAGALGVAVRSMRGALDVEPSAIHQVARTPWLQQRLVYLIALFENRSIWVAPECRAFMLATLHVLQGDRRSAGASVARALELGDRTVSTRALSAEIERASEPPSDSVVPGEPAPVSPARPLDEVLQDLQDITDAALGLQQSLLESLGQPAGRSPGTDRP